MTFQLRQKECKINLTGYTSKKHGKSERRTNGINEPV